jgi:glycosyltransferase involved in cell wall biosynthesis
MMGKKHCIIIPAYNEENRIEAVIKSIGDFSDADIIVVDDGSKDSTAAKAENAGACVIRHPFNMGYGVALQTGYKYALKNQYDLLVQMDGDGQHRAEFIPDLFVQVENNTCDVVIGSRFLSHVPYKLGILKNIGINVFRLLVRMITSEKVTDPTSGYQCLNRKVFEFYAADHFPWDYPDANVIIMLHRAGFRIKEIPVVMTLNREGRSMHRGLFRLSYYMFTVFLSIFVTLIRKSK